MLSYGQENMALLEQNVSLGLLVLPLLLLALVLLDQIQDVVDGILHAYLLQTDLYKPFGLAILFFDFSDQPF